MELLRRSIWIITALLVAVPFFVFAVVHWYENRFDKLPVFGKLERQENGTLTRHEIANFEFQNQDGKIFSSDALKNKIVIANFFFTNCPSICPNMMNHVKEVQNEFLNDRHLAIISFTVDPLADSVKRLKWYSCKYNINNYNWDLLTGTKKEIYKLARKSFYLTADDGDGGANDFIHSDQLVLFDGSRHIRGFYNGTDEKAISALKHDIKKLENEN
jgi:protein SCO1/2